MKFNCRRLGDFIEEVNIKNLINENLLPLGIKKKYFSEHRDDLLNSDLRDFKVIQKNQFCYVPITSRNGERISIALLQKIEKALVSKTYLVFQIKDTNFLNHIYLMLWFRKREFDRYARWHSFGSARENFNWESLCNFQIPIISIKKQNHIINELSRLDEQIQKRQELSKKLRNIIVCFKRYFYDSKKETTLRDNVKLVSRKNKDNKVKNPVGISWKKSICEYGAIIREEDYSKLKIVQKNEFIWNPVLKYICCLSCWMHEEPALVSSSYQVFNIANEEILNVGYLMSCFLDPEFDRYASYHAFGSIRDQFKPTQLLNFKISLIEPEKQILFEYLYQLFLINEKIISLCEKRRELVLENFEWLLED